MRDDPPSRFACATSRTSLTRARGLPRLRTPDRNLHPAKSRARETIQRLPTTHTTRSREPRIAAAAAAAANRKSRSELVARRASPYRSEKERRSRPLISIDLTINHTIKRPLEEHYRYKKIWPIKNHLRHSHFVLRRKSIERRSIEARNPQQKYLLAFYPPTRP